MPSRSIGTSGCHRVTRIPSAMAAEADADRLTVAQVEGPAPAAGGEQGA